MARQNPLVQWMATGLTLAFTRFSDRLSLRARAWLGRRIAHLAYYLVPRIRRVGHANLARAFGGDMSIKERRVLLKKSVENVGIVAAEFTLIPKIDAAFIKRHVLIKGIHNLPRNHGAIIVGAHLGNWEWMAPAMAAMGWPVAEVVRPLNHEPLNRYVDGIRTGGKVTTIPKDASAIKLLSLLKKGFVVGILVDQAQRANAAPTNFFGHPCWSTVGPVILALRAGVPIIPVSMVRISDGRYRLEFERQISLQHSEDWLKDLIANAQRCQDAVERLIRKYPEQWLWIHRRWEARPRLEEEWRTRLRLHSKDAPDNAHGLQQDSVRVEMVDQNGSRTVS
jgi:KDO2-lipid IV(A) lauroyltransferase